jgi:DNA-binding transcriptional ArsR family regulator
MLKQKNVSQTKKVSRLFRMLGQPARLRILIAIGRGEACVCHLEAALGYRQAYISQHLMTLRQMNLVSARREGRNIYYRLTDLAILDLLQEAGQLVGLAGEALHIVETGAKVSGCPCPHCEPEWVNIPLVKVGSESTMSA